MGNLSFQGCHMLGISDFSRLGSQPQTLVILLCSALAVCCLHTRLFIPCNGLFAIGITVFSELAVSDTYRQLSDGCGSLQGISKEVRYFATSINPREQFSQKQLKYPPCPLLPSFPGQTFNTNLHVTLNSIFNAKVKSHVSY